MQFKSLIVLASAASAALAQSVQIGQPAEGFSVQKGANFTVELDRPNSLTGSQEIGISISLISCATNDCAQFGPADLLGYTLYNGPYAPKYAEDAYALPPHENFTVMVPLSIATGKARMAVTHLSLVGASPTALFEIRNVTINVTE